MKFLQKFFSNQNIFIPAVRWVLNSYPFKKVATRFPNFSRFLRNRFATNKFNGLPLTFLGVSFIANLMLLFEIAEDFENSPVMHAIDNSLAQFLFDLRIAIVANIFYYFSLLGSLPVVILVALAATILLLIKKKYVHLIALITALTGTGITVLTGKNYFLRLRPKDFGFYSEVSYSFPSGHATVAMAFYGMLFYIFIRLTPTYKNKFRLFVLALLFISLLGFSRLYLGVHYLSDVIAGFSLGLLWLLSAISILEWKTYSL